MSKTEDSHAVYGKHQSFHGWFNARQITGGIYDAWLKCGCMGELQKWIHIFQVCLPEFEDLSLRWM